MGKIDVKALAIRAWEHFTHKPYMGIRDTFLHGYEQGWRECEAYNSRKPEAKDPPSTDSKDRRIRDLSNEVEALRAALRIYLADGLD